MKKRLTRVVSGIAVCLLYSGVSAVCQTAPTPSSAAETPRAETPRVANVSTVTPAEHPLMPVIRWAEKGRPDIAAIKDYTALVQKQENIGGEVQSAQVLELKVRHQPFSAYVKLRYPKELNGQQAIYIKGKNDGKAYARGNGAKGVLGWQSLDPEGFFMMQNNKYPLTEIGILNLVDKLLEVGYHDMKYDECNVTYFEGKVGTGDSTRECTVIRVVHPVARPNIFRFHIAQIFVDKELNLPIRYESYDWPRVEGESPKLLEVYMYTDLKLNVGLTDADFDHTNPKYAR